ncbi:hypothetical protein [uncultured Psychrobacter sp.]|uniref:hypothetical protein n=1 Tax=uncultured Psychrobacter sp. TaxID=259303 RepID=UPI0025948602|nr:hypothetical protein [uncultured Psychrobacter sp.]
MQNQYIIDAFLSAALWAIVAYLVFEVRARVMAIRALMDVNILSAALASVAKRATLVATPFWAFFIFLLWRFFGLMVDSQTWGAGGAGLLVALFAIGITLIWLNIVLIFVSSGGFVALAHKVSAGGRD